MRARGNWWCITLSYINTNHWYFYHLYSVTWSECCIRYVNDSRITWFKHQVRRCQLAAYIYSLMHAITVITLSGISSNYAQYVTSYRWYFESRTFWSLEGHSSLFFHKRCGLQGANPCLIKPRGRLISTTVNLAIALIVSLQFGYFVTLN